MLLEYACRKQKIRGDTQLDLYAAEPGPMGVAGPAVSKAVRAMVESKGVAYHPEHQVREVDVRGRLLRFTNGVEARFDLLAFVAPHRAPRVVREAGLVAESGWMQADRHTLETKFPGVYAIGDVVAIPLKLGKPLPKAGEFAHAQAQVGPPPPPPQGGESRSRGRACLRTPRPRWSRATSRAPLRGRGSRRRSTARV